MARPKNSIPQPRLHPASGRARVTIEGKDFYLGKFGSAEADEKYRRIVAQWLAKEGPFQPIETDVFTIEELAAAYWLHAEKYYGFDKNKNRGDCHNLKAALGVLKRLYASLPAAKFGPLDLKAIQGEMVRSGWSRSYVNHTVGKVKRIFKWAVGEEMVPPSVWHALIAVPGLKRGRTDATESEPVKPVPLDVVETTKEHLRPVLRALIDFTLLTGCRPNEACQLRPCDIDKSNPQCWVFRPRKHKTESYGRDRLILIGPQAQAVIVFYLAGCDPQEHVFNPQREELRRLEARKLARKTPHTPSSLNRLERAAKRIGKRHPRAFYTTGSLRTAIHRACVRAEITVWGPNRLRHTRATDLREHGLDNVATILGHAKVETSQIYAEKNLKAAMELVSKVG